jgi:hypothetical protein
MSHVNETTSNQSLNHLTSAEPIKYFTFVGIPSPARSFHITPTAQGTIPINSLQFTSDGNLQSLQIACTIAMITLIRVITTVRVITMIRVAIMIRVPIMIKMTTTISVITLIRMSHKSSDITTVSVIILITMVRVIIKISLITMIDAE